MPMIDMADMPRQTEGLVSRFAGRRILVVGDVVADRYVLAEPDRLSREAPVLVTRHVGDELIPGGAANAMNNLVALGAEVLPVGRVGQDARGERLIEHFRSHGLDVSGFLAEPEEETVTKTRIMVGDPDRMKQQVLRIDREPPGPPAEASQARLLERVRERLDGIDAVLLSDYGYGAVSPEVRRLVLEDDDRVVTADSRYDILAFRGISLATPNEGEVEEALGRRIRDLDELETAGRELLERLSSRGLLVTRGNRGMSLFVPGEPRHDVPATGLEGVTDVSGAGDTVISVVTLALATGAGMLDAAWIANLAAGLVVMRVGAATCTPEELEIARLEFA